MTDKQASLGDFGSTVQEADDDSETLGGNADESGTRQRSYSRFELAMQLAPDNAEPFADDSCPWCLAPADDFSQAVDGTVSCGNCEAVIPVDADWYQSGQKSCF